MGLKPEVYQYVYRLFPLIDKTTYIDHIPITICHETANWERIMSIGAVLPLAIQGSYGHEDLERTDLLFRSIMHFSDPTLFDPFWVVVPSKDIDQVKAHLAQWTEMNINVISETDLIPQFKKYKNMRGWRKQQIIKLAAASQLPTDFAITFDADVVCIKPLSVEQLVHNGRALMQRGTKGHNTWWISSAAILKMEADLSTSAMAVTPALLSTQVCKDLINDIRISGEPTWVDELCSLHTNSLKNVRYSRLKMRKWTEYSLYYSFLEKTGQREKYHFFDDESESKNNLIYHFTDNYADVFSSSSLFGTFGSRAGHDPKVVWENIQPFM